MVTYDKPKRKNAPAPPPAIFKIISSLIGGIFYYGLVVPARWLWGQLGRFVGWNWNLTKRFFGWIGRGIGSIFRGTWWLISTVIQKTVFAPFTAVGRLLGFVPNAVPKGLSAKEAEIYQRINRTYRRQKRWYLHIITFLIGMVVTWFSLVVARWDFYPRVDAAVMFTLIWLVLLGTHRLWMNLGKSEDREIGEALQRLRHAEQPLYYEEEIYDERPYATTRLGDSDDHDTEWDEDLIQQTVKAKRQRN